MGFKFLKLNLFNNFYPLAHQVEGSDKNKAITILQLQLNRKELNLIYKKFNTSNQIRTDEIYLEGRDYTT
jgi:hypothetical protein